jgi:hypothetical protein
MTAWSSTRTPSRSMSTRLARAPCHTNADLSMLSVSSLKSSDFAALRLAVAVYLTGTLFPTHHSESPPLHGAANDVRALGFNPLGASPKKSGRVHWKAARCSAELTSFASPEECCLIVDLQVAWGPFPLRNLGSAPKLVEDLTFHSRRISPPERPGPGEWLRQ